MRAVGLKLMLLLKMNMGTHSYTGECPKCLSNMQKWTDTRNGEGGECLECGYFFYIKEDKRTLKEVNELREDFEKKPLKKLKKQQI